MKKIKIHFYILITIFFMSSYCDAPAADTDMKTPSFHLPITDAEKALDHLLKSDKTIFSDHGVSEVSPGFHNYIIGYPGRDQSHDKVYDTLFTAKLLQAWRHKERKFVEANCHGHYINGQLCGVDYDVLTCAQDEDDSYLYRTDSNDGKQALITYMWPENGQQVARYRLIKDGDNWKLDGVKCGPHGDHFNIP